ncbi:MarR family winged helix-turn-helix transcriptional regulator [Bacillus sp. FJAT-42315]|uniref:MarR family winged helix-turn-helix transcriptional regulator n=1 Tax=Bacillus sp. FJAT-42315 TaxID=2014077 RepID=UPI002FCDDCA3
MINLNVSLDEYISIYIHQTDLLITSEVKSRLAPFNIAPEQNLVMMLLWKKDGLSQQEIAEKLKKDKTNIARMLLNLEQKGLIRRVCCQHDRRSLKVFLTEKGDNLKEIIIPIAKEINKQIYKGISEEELQTVRSVLSKMRENLR